MTDDDNGALPDANAGPAAAPAPRPVPVGSSGTGSGSGGLDGAVDIRSAAAVTLAVDLFKPAQTSSPQPETLEEVAEDLLELMKTMSALESRVASLASGVDRLQQLVEGGVHTQLVEIERLKEALVSDRREYIGRATFNALRPAMESLQYLKEGYEERQADARHIQHAQALLDILVGVTQMLGYQSFSPAPGDDFDPRSMECAGYADGAPGKVVKVERSGYRAGSVLVRPSAVILGGQSAA